MKRIAANVALFATSLVLAIIACEGALRLVYPNAALGAGIELSWFRDPGSNMSNYMTTDDQIGFRPRLDTNVFDKNGLLLKPKDGSPSADVTRTVLFVGDSVTARARIVDAVRRELADPKSFFLNGGVESFNLAQVVNFSSGSSRRRPLIASFTRSTAMICRRHRSSSGIPMESSMFTRCRRLDAPSTNGYFGTRISIA